MSPNLEEHGVSLPGISLALQAASEPVHIPSAAEMGLSSHHSRERAALLRDLGMCA